MRTLRPSASRAFTLIEVLTVVSIIAVLIAMIIFVATGLKSRAMTTQTRASLAVLRDAMNDYLKSNPEPSGATNDWLPRLLLTKNGKNLTDQKWCLDSTDNKWTPTSVGPPAKVVDAWGNAILYLPSRSGPAATTFPPGWVAKEQGFFWSVGPNGQPGGNDDMFSEGTGP